MNCRKKLLARPSKCIAISGLVSLSQRTKCLCHELKLRGISHEKQLPLPVHYKGVDLDAAYRIDVKVEGILILELKAVDKLEEIHDAQLLTYLRLSKLWLGLLMNFNVPVMKSGIKRLVQGT